MVFFVPGKLEVNQSKKQSDEQLSDRLDLVLISNAKRIGISLQELNELRVRDFIEMVDIHCGDIENSKNTNQATQEDIDKLLA
ncbi:MAG: hypothetical protein AWU54_337 [Candidatus Frackibacter sp. T328-2]|nr:MAG: hypothetical protein AWU54_337 [Candidatus Frackibacter sp. T328-2]